MLKFICFLISTVLFFSCGMRTKEETISPQQPIGAGPERTFLALGDSYTIGESVEEKDRWSMQLINLLKNEFKFTRHDIIARTGWTTEELIDAITSAKNTNRYDMVSLLIGVNNQYRGQSLEKYRTEFRELLNTGAKFAKNDYQKVFVLSIPDYSITPSVSPQNKAAVSKEIDKFNTVAQDECQKLRVKYIDITKISRANTDVSFIASDQLHFSGKMYNLWAKESVTTAQNILKQGE